MRLRLRLRLLMSLLLLLPPALSLLPRSPPPPRCARLFSSAPPAAFPSAASPSAAAPSVAVVGGGPSGFFAAISLASSHPRVQVTLYESSSRLLHKVLISGGGRCNLLPNTALPTGEILKAYPRGARELISPTSPSSPSGITPAELLGWFNERGVETKVEGDGRTFPVTDDSRTVADCLLSEARKAKVKVVKKALVTAVSPPSPSDPSFSLSFKAGTLPPSRHSAVILATGSSRPSLSLLSALGHTLVPPVPSLFTLTVPSPLLAGLQGLSVPHATVTVPLPPALRPSKKSKSVSQSGPLLITHVGLSGPAALKASAFGARALHELGYRSPLLVNWCAAVPAKDVEALLSVWRAENPRRSLKTAAPPCLPGLPRRLWARVVELSLALPEGQDRAAGTLSKKDLRLLAGAVTSCELEMVGKSTFKEEFVTAGGLSMKEIDSGTFMSRKVPGLFVVGEANDVDAVTGGYNFLNCWVSGHVAGKSAGKFVGGLE